MPLAEIIVSLQSLTRKLGLTVGRHVVPVVIAFGRVALVAAVVVAWHQVPLLVVLLIVVSVVRVVGVGLVVVVDLAERKMSRCYKKCEFDAKPSI